MKMIYDNQSFFHNRFNTFGNMFSYLDPNDVVCTLL